MNLYFFTYQGKMQGYPIEADSEGTAKKEFSDYLETRRNSVLPTVAELQGQIEACEEIIKKFEEGKDSLEGEELENAERTREVAEEQMINLRDGEKGLTYWEDIIAAFNFDVEECNIYKI